MQQRREHRKHSEWVPLIEEQEQSGQTIKEFCELRGLVVASFQSHRSKWKQDQVQTTGFAEIRVPGSTPIRLRFDDRPWTLEISQDFDASLLKRVVHALGS